MENGGMTGRKKFIMNILQWLKALFNNRMNLLLLFVPAGILTHYVGVDPTIVFLMNFIAIIPLTRLISYETKRLAVHCDGILAGLLQATFGNAAELIVSILALTNHEIMIVQTSLLGSVLSNLLLVLSMAFVFSPVERAFASTGLPTLAVGSLTVFHLVSSTSDVDITGASHGIATVLFLVYSSYLAIQLKMPKHHALSSNASTEPEAELEEPRTSVLATFTIMVLATVLVGFCAGGLVSSIDHVVTSSGISRMLVGFALLPTVGSAAEHAKAVAIAVRDKVNLRTVAAVGSTQTALLGVPFVVVVGWCVGVSEATLYSSALLAMVIILMVVGGNHLSQRLQEGGGDLPFAVEI